jgi:hypothetical protein
LWKVGGGWPTTLSIIADVSNNVKNNQGLIAQKKVGNCKISFPSMIVNMVQYLLMLDVNGLLCQAMHVTFREEWKPLLEAMRCGNKFVSPQLGYCEFLEMCGFRFDIGT